MLTWRSIQKNNYESKWGICERFRFLNQLNNKEFITLLSSSSKNIALVKLKNELDQQERLMVENLSYKGINEKNESFISDNIRFCPICIKYGFHSYFHQFSLINICVFHLEKLTLKCPKCNKTTNYRQHNDSFINTFICTCTYKYAAERNILKAYLDPNIYLLKHDK